MLRTTTTLATTAIKDIVNVAEHNKFIDLQMQQPHTSTITWYLR